MSPYFRDKFKTAFVTAAGEQFGGGWVLPVQEGDALKSGTTFRADALMARGQTKLLTGDAREHASDLDGQKRRDDSVQAFRDHPANREFAALRML